MFMYIILGRKMKDHKISRPSNARLWIRMTNEGLTFGEATLQMFQLCCALQRTSETSQPVQFPSGNAIDRLSHKETHPIHHTKTSDSYEEHKNVSVSEAGTIYVVQPHEQWIEEKANKEEDDCEVEEITRQCNHLEGYDQAFEREVVDNTQILVFVVLVSCGNHEVPDSW